MRLFNYQLPTEVSSRLNSLVNVSEPQGHHTVYFDGIFGHDRLVRYLYEAVSQHRLGNIML